MSLRCLTFGRRAQYARHLTQGDHRWDVVCDDPEALREPWLTVRRFAPGARVVGLTAARRLLARGAYDVVVAHDLFELAEVAGVPTVTVFHAPKAIEVACGADRAALEKMAREASARGAAVFTAEDVRQSWGVEGTVIPPAVDPDDYGLYTGDLPRVLVASDFEGARALVMGRPSVEDALDGLPVTLMGVNPGSAVGWTPRNTAERRAAYRRHRVFVNLMSPHECGCPLALLEAMAAGMPIVTLTHPFTPIAHGATGLVGSTSAAVREHILELLEDRELALALGRAARQAAVDGFAPAAFRAAWQQVLGRGSLEGVGA